jgi:hypothetical protein
MPGPVVITVTLITFRFKPHFNVVGFPSNITLKDQISRKDFLYDIVRDIQTLSQCQAVVCGMSSNVNKRTINECFKKNSLYILLLFEI